MLGTDDAELNPRPEPEVKPQPQPHPNPNPCSRRIHDQHCNHGQRHPNVIVTTISPYHPNVIVTTISPYHPSDIALRPNLLPTNAGFMCVFLQ